LKTENRLQDIRMSNFKVGVSGNQVLKNSREQAIIKGIKPSIYMHTLGFYGRAGLDPASQPCIATLPKALTLAKKR